MYDSYDELYDTMLKLRGVVTSYLKRKQEQAKP